MLTIALMACKEAVRRRILAVTALLAVIFLGLFGIALYYANKEMMSHAAPLNREIFTQQMFSLELYFGSFIVSFLAIFISVGLISGEMESGVINMIAVRPVRRSEIITGKLLGSGFMLIVCASVFLLVISYLVHAITGLKTAGLATALPLFCLQPLILLCVATLGSVVLPTVANGILMFMLYAIAVVGGMIEQIGYFLNSRTMQNIGIISSLIMPVDAVYRKIVHILLGSGGFGSALTQMGSFGSQAEPSTAMMAYTVIYMAASVMLAVYAFNKKDMA